MAKEFSRTQRVAQQVKKEIALILQREIKDSRIGMATVSDVEISRDLAYAKVYLTFFSIGDQTPESQLAAVRENKGMIRSLLGKAIRLRVTPDLTFFFDESLTEGMRMSNLVTQIIESDKVRRNNDDEEQQ